MDGHRLVLFTGMQGITGRKKAMMSKRCRWLDWHTPGPVDSDGLTLVSHCVRCGKRIGQDSQGNWFRW